LTIVIIDLNKPDELVTVELPRAAPEKGSQTKESVVVIQSLYADPTARHLIITTNSGDTFYLPITPGNAATQSRRPRPLRIRQSVTSVAWSPISGTQSEGNGDTAVKGDAITPPATDVLLGTSTGQVLSLPLPPQDDIFKSVQLSMSKPLERDLQTVYTVPDGQTITGLAFGFWPGATASGKNAGKTMTKRAWVVITTMERIYEVQGNVSTMTAGGRWAEEVFKPIRDTTPSMCCIFQSDSSLNLRRIPRTPR
jgi:hypothetical protein